MASRKRQLTRTKSTRPALEVSDDYKDCARTLLKASYPSYYEAKQAVDDWQQLAGQLTFVDEEIYAGKRPKRGSQPAAVTLICKSAEDCYFTCLIKSQPDAR
jgi:hypothetical protein